jgi:NAD(P)-dependent dehydrogenase (short-subunit alcohol dehydrogenase family)
VSRWLEGKAALVTGGGSGIGRAVVDAFLDEGASVCVLELSDEKCASLQRVGGLRGERLAVVRGDATRAADNDRAVATAVERFGRLDILATFVGIFDLYTPLTEVPADRFDAAFAETFDVNVKSVMLAARAAVPRLRETRGNIVVTGSSSSFYPGRGGSLYVASKFALRGLVLQLAHELAPDVRVNAVAPGGTLDTDLRGLRTLGQFEHRLNDRSGREASLRARTPLAVALRPEEHAAAYVYLASDRCPGVSGEILRSDGGMGIR